jgi:hypothetical protein
MKSDTNECHYRFTKSVDENRFEWKAKKNIYKHHKSSGDTLIVLIDDILDLAKVDGGKWYL